MFCCHKKKKKSTAIMVIAIVLGAAVAAAGAYILFTKVFKDKLFKKKDCAILEDNCSDYEELADGCSDCDCDTANDDE